MINLKIREKAIIATKARLVENHKTLDDFTDEDLEIIIADEERKIIDYFNEIISCCTCSSWINFFV